MVEIRALTLNDLPQVQVLADESVREGFRFVQRFADTWPATSLDTPQQFFLGAFNGEQLLAIGGVTPDPYVSTPHVGRIRHVFVRRHVRRQGLASRLLDALERRARPVYTKLRLRTDTDAAALFYEQAGYARSMEPQASHIREWFDAHGERLAAYLERRTSWDS